VPVKVHKRREGGRSDENVELAVAAERGRSIKVVTPGQYDCIEKTSEEQIGE